MGILGVFGSNTSAGYHQKAEKLPGGGRLSTLNQTIPLLQNE